MPKEIEFETPPFVGDDPFFVDKWCAKHIRKVSFCEECLHHAECLEKGHSVAPSAIERKERESKAK